LARRGGPIQAVIAVLATVLACCGQAGFSAPEAGPSLARRRIVSVRILADPSLGKNAVWKVDILRDLSDASLTLSETCRVSLKIKAYEYWPAAAPGPEGGETPTTAAGALALINRHLRSEGRGGAEIVIGLVAEGPDGPVIPGIADYLNGTVAVKYLKSKGGIPFVLLHELCHIFGAVDLKTKGSVMSLKNPRPRIDDFTKAILRANRLRSFGDGFPLSAESVSEATKIYEGRRARGLGEEELDICLGELRKVRARQGQEPRPPRLRVGRF